MLLKAVEWCSGRGEAGLCVALTFYLIVAGAAVAASPLPKTAEQLVAIVRTAIAERDMATFDALINWEGASAIKRRIVGFEVRRGLGRPVRSIILEPFPHDGLRKMEAGGALKANMPVSHQLRVVYDELPMEGFGIPPTAVFLIGREGEAFRIALVVRAEKDND
jgi:hypothetical protein